MKSIVPPLPPDDDGRRGRPSKLTDALFRAFIDLFLKGSFRQTACRELGIDYSTFARWIQRGRREPGTIYAEFRAGVLCAESRSQNNLLGRVQAASSEDWKAAAWILERKFPELFGAYRGEVGDVKRESRDTKRELQNLKRELARATIGAAEKLPDPEDP